MTKQPASNTNTAVFIINIILTIMVAVMAVYASAFHSADQSEPRWLLTITMMAITEGTMLQIEALSESINNLTYLLSQDELRRELRRSQTALV